MTSNRLKHKFEVGLSLMIPAGILGAGIYDGRILPIVGAASISCIYLTGWGLYRALGGFLDLFKNKDADEQAQEERGLYLIVDDEGLKQALKEIMGRRRNRKLIIGLYSYPSERQLVTDSPIDQYRDENGIDRSGHEFPW